MIFYLVHKKDLRCRQFDNVTHAAGFLWGKKPVEWLLVREGVQAISLKESELDSLTAEIRYHLEAK